MDTEATTDQIIEVCVRCKRKHGKESKPFRPCVDCGSVICHRCAPVSRYAIARCPDCESKKWKAEFEASQKARLERTAECPVCHTTKLVGEFVNSFVPGICKECDRIAKEVNAAAQKLREEAAQRNWKPGTNRRVVVDGRYTYETNLPVSIGSRVLLPRSLASQFYDGGEWEGVVTSLISDYHGECSRIVRIIDPA